MVDVLRVTLLGAVLATASVDAGGAISIPETTEIVSAKQDISPLYLGLGFTVANFHSCGSGCTYEDKTYGGMLRLGYDLNSNLGFEARASRSFWGEGPFGGVPLQYMGIFVKPQISLGENFNLYGLLGYGYTENLGNGARLNYFDSDDGFSAGVGVEYRLSSKKYVDEQRGDSEGRWSLFLDYQRLLIKSSVPAMDLVTFGLRYDFDSLRQQRTDITAN